MFDGLEDSFASQASDALNLELRRKKRRDGLASKSSSVENGASEGLNEPELGIIPGDALELSNSG